MSQKNGQPIRFGAITDQGRPGWRQVYSVHLTVGAARRAIHHLTQAEQGGNVAATRQWWVAEIDPKVSNWGEIGILAYWPEGPYSEAHRPDVSARKVP